MYESPIKIFYGEMEMQLEGEVLKAVQSVGVTVDKEELLKALNHDRNQYEKGYEDGLNANRWIPCSERLPEVPEKNPEIDNKPLELYLVSVRDTKYPFRAFWNGRDFTDGWTRVDAVAWMPLPEPYKGE